MFGTSLMSLKIVKLFKPRVNDEAKISELEVKTREIII